MGVAEGEEDGEGRLQEEVDGEDVGLEDGELGAGEDAEGYYSADEGLEEGAA